MTKLVESFTILISLATLGLNIYYYGTRLELMKQLQRAQTFTALHTEYSSPETADSLELIEDFIEDFGTDSYSEVFVELLTNGDPLGMRLDRARRRLVLWYSRVHYFFQFGYLSSDDLNMFPGAERACYFIDIVEPLEVASRISTGREQIALFEWLRKQYNLSPMTMKSTPGLDDGRLPRTVKRSDRARKTHTGSAVYSAKCEKKGNLHPHKQHKMAWNASAFDTQTHIQVDTETRTDGGIESSKYLSEEDDADTCGSGYITFNDTKACTHTRTHNSTGNVPNSEIV
eukprot:GHVR01003213.1.p1 GENE.GHVR01003213.1~~GHVR01003213.1.p1  ORF type:complete len:287 (-),score=50.28 GHVR01003213.1:91-951(-)